MQLRRIGGCFCLSAAAGIGLFCGSASLARSSPTTETAPASAPASQPVVLADLFAIFIDDRAVPESKVAARIAALTAQRMEAARNGGPSAAVAAAEFIVARQIEPSLSREILEVASDADHRFIQERTAVAAGLL